MTNRTNYTASTLPSPCLTWSRSVFLSLAMLCNATAYSSLAWADTNVPSSGLTESHSASWSTNYTTNATSGTAPFTINITGTYVTYSGTISDGTNAKVSLTVNEGSGGQYLFITQKQNYSGGTTLNEDMTVKLYEGGTLGNSNLVFPSRGYLFFEGYGYGVGDNAFKGYISTGSSRISFNNTSPMEISGLISGSGGISVYKTLKLSNTNNFGGSIYIANQGALELAAEMHLLMLVI